MFYDDHANQHRAGAGPTSVMMATVAVHSDERFHVQRGDDLMRLLVPAAVMVGPGFWTAFHSTSFLAL